MIAAKAMDPVMGIDIHIVQPPGPVPPIPIPHPFVGMLIDPMDFAPIIGATVLVNGMPRATAGTGGQCVPPHIPIGGMFVKPPGNECEVFMGSSTVLADGDPLSHLGLPALSCHDIGMPPPPRLKKKRKPKSLALPTSVVLAIPAGAPVLVGGPPTISMMALGMKAAMAGLGKAFKKLKKLQKASRKMKAVSDRIQKAAKKAMDKLGVPPSVQNKVHRAICTVTGHPVDVATGKVFTEDVDFQLPGPIPFRWERVWYSSSVYRGPLGHGWHHPYDLSLVEDEVEGVVAMRMADGRPVAFPALPVGEESFHRAERITLFRDEGGYGLRDRSGFRYRFGPPRHTGDPQPLASVEDGIGSAIRLSYDSAGHLAAIIDSAGRLLQFQLDGDGRIVALFTGDPDDPEIVRAVVSYAYDADGNLVAVRDALGGLKSYEYVDHLLVRETGRDGLSFHFHYDTTGPSARCIRTWGDGGIFDHKLTYDRALGLTTVEDSLSHATQYRSNPAGLVTAIIDSLGGESHIEYDEHNQVVAEIDASGATFAYAYDDLGNLVGVARPDGSRISLVYEQNRPVEVTDAVGGVWRWQYDAAGRVLCSEDPLGGTTPRRYEGAVLVELLHPGGLTERRSYDRAGNLVRIETPDGGVTTWAYDFWGRPTLRIAPDGARERRRFDLLGRVVQVDDPDGSVRRFEHDREGRIVHAGDGNRDVAFVYTGMGRVAAKEEAGVRVAFEYDTEGRLVTVVNERGLAYRYELDANGRVIAETGFDGARRAFRRDALGRVTRVDRPGGRFTEFEYDPLDRVVEIRYSDGEACRYAWRADGELVRAENSACVVVLDRDALGRIVRERQGDHWVASDYDGNGQRIRVRSSLGLEQLIGRDRVGDPRALQVSIGDQSTWQVAFATSGAGREVERLLPGDLRAGRSYDAAGRLTAHEVWRKGERVHSQLANWAAGPRIESTVDAWGATQFAYAERDFLAGARYADGALELRVPDAAGNLFRTEARDDRKYGPAGELLSAGDVVYDYDEEGNLVRRVHLDGREWRYRWSGAGKLVAVQRPDGSLVTFAYDALGRRIRKTAGRCTTHWIWDGHRPIHELTKGRERANSYLRGRARPDQHAAPRRAITELLVAAPSTGPPADDGPAGMLTWLFEPNSFAPLAKIVDGHQWFSIVANHLGTPTAMFDEGGQPVWKAEFDLNGAVRRVEGDAGACPFRLPGQYEDEETGLYYNRFRYYDPIAGTYISQDPIRLRGGLGLYAYVRDVLTALDPFGLQTLYHYTTEEGMQGITSSETLNPSIGDKNARFGHGQYLTDIPPENIGGRAAKDLTDADRAAGKISQGQAAANIYGDARKHRNLDSFVEIDVTGLDVEEPRPGTFLIRGEKPLDLKGRIVRSGKTCGA